MTTQEPLPTEDVDRAFGDLRGIDAAASWAGAAYAGALVVWWLSAGRPDETSLPGVAFVHVPLGLVVAFLALRVAARQIQPHAQLAWHLLGLAAILLPAADVIGAAVRSGVVEARGFETFAGLLSHPVFLAAAILLPPSLFGARNRAVFGLDAAIVATGGWMVLWEFALRGFLSSPGAGAPTGSVVAAYAVGDVMLLIGIASLLLRCPRGTSRQPFLLLALSLFALLLADLSLLGHEVSGGLHHPIRAVHGVLCIAALTLKLRGRVNPISADDERTIQAIGWLPHAAAAAACVTFVTAMVRSASGAEVLLALAIPTVVVTALVLTRLIIASREVVRLRRERRVLAGEARFRSLVQYSADMIYVVDSTWTITFASPSVPETLGYRTSHLVGSSVLDLIHPEDVVDAGSRLRECLADPSRPMRGRWRMRRNDQTHIYTETVCANLVRDENIRGVVLTMRDVSERNSLEAQLAHRAFHDPLTGLANRALFQDRVQHALARRRGEFGRLGVVYLDLDHFKAVNDRLGHAAGDALLRAAAQRLVSGLRAFDTAARLGGDEFAVLIDDIPRDDEVIQVADRIARAFRDPFVFDGREVTTSASVGVALAAPGQGAEELLRNADLAMYLAKSRGRGQAVLFEPSMHAAALTRQELQRDLQHALARGELSLVYQPIHTLDTQLFVGAEALLRWVHPTRGPIPPSTFVPIAEESGLMVDIGHWVIRTACVDAQAWRSRGTFVPPLRVWINLSIRQLSEDDLCERVAQAIAESGIDPGAIVLELTERMLLQYKERTIELMDRLKTLGVHLAIDDFGTGYSSLSHLQRLPIDVLKIDRVFVDAIASDEHASALARTVVNLGESMSLEIVAEGIENAEQVERLRALGCNAGQGFFFGMPMPSQELAEYAERWRTFSSV